MHLVLFSSSLSLSKRVTKTLKKKKESVEWLVSTLQREQCPIFFKVCNLEVLALPLFLQILPKTCSPCHFQEVLCYTEIILCALY